MKNIKIIIRILLWIAGIIALYLAVIIVYATLTNYRPENEVPVEVSGGLNPEIPMGDTLTFLSWNIGFCGLGAEMDFFYDNGKMVRPTDELVEKYTRGVTQYLQEINTVDFILLQETDENSARTNRQNEINLISESMPDYFYSYADNYNVQFVPLPFTNPLGKVEAGQLNLSKIQPLSSQRLAFHSAYAWPKNLFMLDRCFVVSRFDSGTGKQLVVLNTHNSAYDKGGKLRMVEMPVIRDFMVNEYEKGNYVIAGGDWNQNPPDYRPSEVEDTYPPVKREAMDGGLFPPGWNIVFDPSIPTNREIDAPLQKGITESTIIDYYIVSPNVEAISIKTYQENFEFSDHNPVFLQARLIRN